MARNVRRLFDAFSERSERVAAGPTFFAFCVALILVWLPLIVFLSVDTWQLIINTITTCITFLLVALFTNTQRRREKRTEQLLTEIAGRLERLERHTR